MALVVIVFGGANVRPPPPASSCGLDRTRVVLAVAPPNKIVSFTVDENFRKGACHAAAWFLTTSRTLIAEGRDAKEIADHLADMAEILAEWRSGAGELPDGNPWDWSYKDLASAIKTRKEA